MCMSALKCMYLNENCMFAIVSVCEFHVLGQPYSDYGGSARALGPQGQFYLQGQRCRQIPRSWLRVLGRPVTLLPYQSSVTHTPWGNCPCLPVNSMSGQAVKDVVSLHPLYRDVKTHRKKHISLTKTLTTLK